MPYFESLAAALALAYLVLAMREHLLCWFAALVSAALYTVVFLEVKLYTEAGLQLFYIAITLHGYRRWQQEQRASTHTSSSAQIHRLSAQGHFIFVALSSAASLLLGSLFALYTDADMPFLDAAITSWSIATTYLVAEKVLENWLYWIGIDLIASGVYLAKELYITSALFLLYVALAIRGYQIWKTRMKKVPESGMMIKNEGSLEL